MTKLLPAFGTEFHQYELVPEKGGHFEILVDGTQVYSKLATGAFPNEDEILQAVRALVTS